MKKSLSLIPVVAALAVWSKPAAAADPIPSGTIALGAERLSGFYHSSETVGNTDVTRNKISLLGENVDGLGENLDGQWDLPRIGIDGFVIDGLSLGGTLAIAHTSTTAKGTVGPANASVDSSETDFLFAPRVGYAIMFSDNIGIWPRGGFSYFLATNSVDRQETTTRHYFSLNIEAPFLFKLAPNFAIMAGPTIDVSLEGSQKVAPVAPNGGPTVTADASYTAFGIAAGLVALL